MHLDTNVHCAAVQGTFDDCHDILKGLFGDSDFMKMYGFGAMNSIKREFAYKQDRHEYMYSMGGQTRRWRLLHLHLRASDPNDAQLTDLLRSNFLEMQVESYCRAPSLAPSPRGKT